MNVVILFYVCIIILLSSCTYGAIIITYPPELQGEDFGMSHILYLIIIIITPTPSIHTLVIFIHLFNPFIIILEWMVASYTAPLLSFPGLVANLSIPDETFGCTPITENVAGKVFILFVFLHFII